MSIFLDFSLKVLPRFLPIVTGLVAVIIAYLSLMPQREVPDTGLDDQLGHLVAYFALATLSIFAFRRFSIWSIAAVLVAYGFGLEYLQGVMPFDRHASIADGMANAAGVALGLAVSSAARKVVNFGDK